MTKRFSRKLSLTCDSGEFPKTVAVFRALQLGDMLCAVPALRALREAWPKARITLVGLPWAASFVARFSRYCDNFREFPGWEGIPECGYDPVRMERFRQGRTAHDLVIQLHGNGSITNQFLPELGPRFMAGFHAPGHPCPDPTRFIPYPEGEHEIRRLLRLLEHLGIPLKGEHLEFPLSPADEREAAELQGAGLLPAGQFVCLHVGACDPRRRWPIENFLQVGRGLLDKGFRVVLTGTAEEASQTGWLAERLGGGSSDLAAKTTLGGLGALLKRARLLISNDTGISHVSAALGVPSVIIFSASDPRRWAPLDQTRHRAVGDPMGPSAAKVRPETVLDEASRLLAASASRLQVRGGGIGELPAIPWAQIKRLLLVYLGGPANLLTMAPAIRAVGTAGRETALLVSPPAAAASCLLDGVKRLLTDQDQTLTGRPVFASVCRLVRKVRSGAFDAAIIFTGASDHPYDAAYVCYLAGIPIRIAASKEFGGALLTHWIRRLGEGTIADRSSALLRLIGVTVPAGETGIVLPRATEGRVVRDLGERDPGLLRGFVLADRANFPAFTGRAYGLPVISRPAAIPVVETAALVKLSRIVVTADPVVARLADAFRRPLVLTGSEAAAPDHWRPRHTQSRFLPGVPPDPVDVAGAVKTLLWIEELATDRRQASEVQANRVKKAPETSAEL